MMRVLLLTSVTGFLARTCRMKIVAALVLALLFLIVYLYARPYKRLHHTIMQGLAMTLPILSMSWALAGGWEDALRQSDAGLDADAAASEYDGLVMVVLHALLVAPPVLVGLFTIASTAYVWRRARAALVLESSLRYICATLRHA